MTGQGEPGVITHRYYAIELFDSRAAGLKAEDLLAGRE